ncbi:MAG: hypothetical protein GY816_13675 [Cytophagales bacterium]|nr:hypothetical protein [Cytophagales bacterium]
MTSEKKKSNKLHPIQIGIEIAVVAIGILIAFQLSNWRIARDRSNMEIEILQEIKSNLELDLIDINGNTRGHKEKLNLIDTLRNFKNSSMNDYEVGLYLNSIFRDYLLTPQTSAFETLKAKGVDLIRNDSLRMQILRMYDFNYVTMIKVEEQWGQAQFFEDLKYIRETYYDRFDMVKQVVKPKQVDNAWLSKPDIQIRLDHVANEITFILQFYEILNGELNKTIEEIDMELGK